MACRAPCHPGDILFLPELLGLNVFAGIDTSRLETCAPLLRSRGFRARRTSSLEPVGVFAGFPQLAESESGVFYPGNILSIFREIFLHWYSVEVVAHFMVAAAGFYLWMRHRGHEKVISALLAATYCTTPFLIFHHRIRAVHLDCLASLVHADIRYRHGRKTSMAHRPVARAFYGIHADERKRPGRVSRSFRPASLRRGQNYRAAGFNRAKTHIPESSRGAASVDSRAGIAAIQLLPTAELSAVSERAATNDMNSTSSARG